MQTLREGNTLLGVVSYTKNGEPGMIEGLPVWTIDPPEMADVMSVAEDGMSATFTWMREGSAKLTVTADGDLGSGVFDVVVSEDFSFEMSLGADTGVLEFTPA